MKALGVPVVQIDEAMMEEAVKTGGRILVVATHGPTVKSTQSLLRETAERLGKKVDFVGATVEEAFELLGQGRIAEHNAVIADAIRAGPAAARGSSGGPGPALHVGVLLLRTPTRWPISGSRCSTAARPVFAAPAKCCEAQNERHCRWLWTPGFRLPGMKHCSSLGALTVSPAGGPPSFEPEAAPPSFFERTWRWWVLATLFLATFLNYLARATLSGTADPICAEFGLDQAQRGRLLAAFVYAYATAHLFIGFLLDRVRNVRWVFPLFVVGWSVSNMLVRWAGSYSSVYGLQTVLGIWESANFPICLMLISRLFSPQQRAFASGIFYSGAVVANLVASKIVIHLASAWNWRWAFFFTGALGFLWIIPWLLIFRHPERRALNWPKAGEQTPVQAMPVGDVLRKPAFWGVALTGMGIIPGLYFVTQWLPSYLTHAWHVPYSQALGNRLALIAFCQDLGMWLGGVPYGCWPGGAICPRWHRVRRLFFALTF